MNSRFKIQLITFISNSTNINSNCIFCYCNITVYNFIGCKTYKHIQVSPVWNQVFNKVSFLNVIDHTHVYNLPVLKAGMYRHLVYNQMCQ